MEQSSLIAFKRISKRFGGVTALNDVSFSVRQGECHGLMGENGAGKSTLGKILAGIHEPDAGSIALGNTITRFHSPADAVKAGIGMVHQELSFCPDLSVAENLCLGHYPRRFSLFLNRAEMIARAENLLKQIGVSLDLHAPMRSLSTAQEQQVQIAAAVGTGANILIFDEPTSSLSENESQHLFSLITSLKNRGVTVLYVSHRLPEVLSLCDRITVLRDGAYVGTINQNEATEDRLVEMMIGRTLDEYFPKHLAAEPGPIILEVDSLASPGKFSSVSFSLRKGEILGLAGLVGSGRSDIALSLFGLDSKATGRVTLNGTPLPPGNIRQSMRMGIGLVPEDRKRQGLVPGMGCRENFSLAMLKEFTRHLLIDRCLERRHARELFRQLDVKSPSLDTPVTRLSGGNQQKVVLAKWLARASRVLIIDEPTRGVDVGAKAAIHALIDSLARKGMAIILISSELPEILNLSTRILILREGRLAGTLSHNEASQEKLLRLMAGVVESTAAFLT